MEREQKRSTLKQTCYRSFLLAVIPLVLVLVGAEGTVGYIIRGSAMETIGALQENIAAGISSELRAKSLRLSRFVYANGGFTAIQNETAFDYKKPGAQMLTGGVDLDAIAARSSDLEAAVEDFFRKFGCHPSAVLADRIYQTRRRDAGSSLKQPPRSSGKDRGCSRHSGYERQPPAGALACALFPSSSVLVPVCGFFSRP